MVRRPYPPGKKGKRRFSVLSEYGKQLKEKQKIKNWYNLGERQFRKYVKEVLEKRGGAEDVTVILIRKLESRFENVIFRLGLAPSRAAARQMITHRCFFINDKTVNLPSYQLKVGDKVSIRPSAKKRGVFQKTAGVIKKHQPPSWLQLDAEKMEGKMVGLPKSEDAVLPVEISAIFELYSR